MYPWISRTLDLWLQFCEKKCGLYMDVYGISLRLHGHNRLQSVMTETHAGNGGTKVVDQLLIDISSGDSSVVGSQVAARDNIQTIDSGKSVS